MATDYGQNTSLEITSYVVPMYDAAKLAARARNFITDCVYVPTDSVAGSATRSRSEYGTVTFNQQVDGQDLSSQVFTPSVGNTITPYEYAAQVFITDRRLRNSPFSEQADAARELGEGAAKHIQTKVLSYLSSLTGGTVGTAGGTITWANIYAARALLEQQNSDDDISLVLQAGQWYYLAAAMAPGVTQVNAPAGQDEILNRYYKGMIAGIGKVYVTSDIVSGTAAVGGMFSRQAIAFDPRQEFKIEPQRDASRFGWEFNASMDYATGVWRPKFGVQLIGTSVVA